MLFFNRSDKRATFSIFEKVFDESPDSILLLNDIGASLLFSQSAFKVLLDSDVISLFILKFQAKISQNPNQTWKILCHFIWVIL